MKKFSTQESIDNFKSNLKTDYNGCLLWQKAKDVGGYGVTFFQSKVIKAHRLAWTLENGPIPAGMSICHRCDVRECCNTAHLFLGTSADNMADCSAKGRTSSGDQHWLRMHPERRMRGEKNGNAKLTLSQVAEIRSLRGQLLQREIAARFGVAKSSVSKIHNNQKWKVS